MRRKVNDVETQRRATRRNQGSKEDEGATIRNNAVEMSAEELEVRKTEG
jgi:hypothetical protein